MDTSSSFRFSSTQSFQLFTQGLQALQAYERNASSATLSDAEENFHECVNRFPVDIWPRFYYGVVKTLQGYDGLDEAIQQFNYVLASKADDLVPDAKFNLAVAHIERYNAQDSAVADALLKETRQEIAKRTKGKPDLKLEAVRLQSLILEAYLFIQETAPSEDTFQQMERLLNSFFEEYNRSAVPEFSRADLLADYYNTWGTYWQLRAGKSDGDQRKTFAEKARDFFEQALKQKKNWTPAKSNLARVYQDFLGDYNTAKRLWQEVLEVRPRDYYTFYLLGKIYETEKAYGRAVGAYKRAAVNIPEARLNLALLYETLGDRARAILYLEGVIADGKARSKTVQLATEAAERIRKSSLP